MATETRWQQNDRALATLQQAVESHDTMLSEIKATMNGILKHFDYYRQKGIVPGSEGDSDGNFQSTHSHTSSPNGRSFRFGRMDFPKFHGEDVVGWLDRCEHFFKVDNVPEEQKIDIVTIHVDGDALLWHQTYVKMKELQGNTLTWAEYSSTIQARFGLSNYYDPMLDLRNLQQEESVTEYYKQFSTIFHHIQLHDVLSEKQSLSNFIGGLRPELQGPIRMLQPKTMYDVFR